MKKTASKVAHNRPKFLFSSIANRPKISPNLIFDKNGSLPDFYIMTLVSHISHMVAKLAWLFLTCLFWKTQIQDLPHIDNIDLPGITIFPRKTAKESCSYSRQSRRFPKLISCISHLLCNLGKVQGRQQWCIQELHIYFCNLSTLSRDLSVSNFLHEFVTMSDQSQNRI